jgi:hypothetical protein
MRTPTVTDDDRLNALIDALRDPETREHTIRQLPEDPRLIDPLTDVLRSGDAGRALAYKARQYAVEALARYDDPRILPALTIALHDDHSAVKVSAAQALAERDDPQAVAPLLEILDDESEAVRTAVVSALGTIGKRHPVSVEPVIARLADHDDAVRRATNDALLNLGVQAVPPLVDALDHPNSTVRGAAATLLGELGDQRAMESLRSASYDDASEWVRSRAKEALKKFGVLDEEEQREAYNLPSPQDTLEVLRKRGPQAWPSLQETPQPPEPPAPPTPDPDSMSAEQIQDMLDQLDMRLMNGEISEATYQRLVERWQRRLDARD